MKRVVAIAALALFGTTQAVAADRIGERCTGSETVQVGTQPPKTVSYSLVFSADLTGRRYCYDKCTRDETYPIGDPSSSPIKLADLDGATTSRHILFDPVGQRLTDDQLLVMGSIRVVRKASATCRPAPFQQPPTN